VRHRIGGEIEHQVDPPRDQVLHGRPEPAIGHKGELRLRQLLKPDRVDVRGAADAGRSGHSFVIKDFLNGLP
jgi:hypothetical protein